MDAPATGVPSAVIVLAGVAFRLVLGKGRKVARVPTPVARCWQPGGTSPTYTATIMKHPLHPLAVSAITSACAKRAHLPFKLD